MPRLSCRLSRPRVLRGPDDVAEWIRTAGVEPSLLLVLGLDARARATSVTAMVAPPGHAAVGAGALANCADELGVADLVAAWVVERGRPAPHQLEIAAAVALADECRSVGVRLVDSIVVSGHRWWSFRELYVQINKI